MHSTKETKSFPIETNIFVWDFYRKEQMLNIFFELFSYLPYTYHSWIAHVIVWGHSNLSKEFYSSGQIRLLFYTQDWKIMNPHWFFVLESKRHLWFNYDKHVNIRYIQIIKRSKWNQICVLIISSISVTKLNVFL